MKIIEQHRKGKPFAIIISKEMTGTNYVMLYQDRYIRCHTLKKWEIRWFCDNINLFTLIISNGHGKIYEYRQFRKKMDAAKKHNFLVRNMIIKDGYI